MEKLDPTSTALALLDLPIRASGGAVYAIFTGAS
jgi:hypothetical protein